MRTKLTVLTLVTMFVAASVVAPKHPEKGLSNADISVTELPPPAGTIMPVRDLWFATMQNEASEAYRRETYVSPISDAEAIDIAIQKGEAIAATRDAQGRYEPGDVALEPVTEPAPETPAVVESADPAPEPEPAAEPAQVTSAPVWTVIGDRVNLRAGPGTEHGIVGVANAGETVTPLSGIGTEWVEVQRADGSLAWIFARFVEPSNT